MRIIHYRNDCIGCDLCADLDPGRWEMDHIDGKSNLLEGVNTKNDIFMAVISVDEFLIAREIEDGCPVNIIKVTE